MFLLMVIVKIMTSYNPKMFWAHENHQLSLLLGAAVTMLCIAAAP